MLAMVMGLTTLVGFDAAANLAEDSKDPYRSVPRAIVGSAGGLAAGTSVFDRAHRRDRRHFPGQCQPVTGRVDHARSARSDDGTDAAGRDCIRVLRRRDGDPGHLLADRLCDGTRRSLSRSRADAASRPRTHTPIPATILIVVVGVVLMIALPGAALLELITTGTIIGPILYGAIVVL